MAVVSRVAMQRHVVEDGAAAGITGGWLVVAAGIGCAWPTLV
jgi:hypothetical protein